MADVRRVARRAVRSAALGLIAVSAACTPLDDALVAVFGRSMRSQASFDPYENPRLPAEGSVPFSAGNYPSGPFEINVGQAEVVDSEPAPITQSSSMMQE